MLHPSYQYFTFEIGTIYNLCRHIILTFSLKIALIKGKFYYFYAIFYLVKYFENYFYMMN